MKKYISLCVGLLLGTSLVVAKGEVASKNGVSKKSKKELFKVVSERVYGGKSDDIAKGVVALKNGESVIVGTCRSFGARRGDICLFRAKADGNMRWRRLIGGKRKEIASRVVRSADGSLLVLGQSKSYSKDYDFDILVAKVSVDGKILWQHTYGGKRDEYAGGIVGTDDGGAVIVGSSESFGNGYKDIYILRIDKNGKKIKEFAVGGKRDEVALGVTRTRYGKIVMVGSSETKRSGDSDFFAMSFDQNMKILWKRSFGGDDEDILKSVSPTIDGGVVAAGSTRSYGSDQTDLVVAKLSSKGDLETMKLYGFKYYEYANDIALIKDGGHMVVGGTNTLGKGDHDAYLLAFDAKTSLKWSHVYGKDRRDVANAVAQLDDGSILIVGYSESFSLNKKFYMIKLRKTKSTK